MIEWIVKVIWTELKTLSEYSLEYASALLMNLTLRTIGKNACENPELKVPHLLYSLIEHNNDQIRTYVNGTLFSLFSRRPLWDMAKALGMDTYMKQILE